MPCCFRHSQNMKCRMAQTIENNSHPGAALRTVRMEQGLTLRELAQLTGMPFSTLSKLENGKMAFTYDKLLKLAQGLGVDIGSFITVEPPALRRAAVGRRSVIKAGKWAEAGSKHERHHYLAGDLLGKMMLPMVIDVVATSVSELGGLVHHAGEEFLYVISGVMELHSDIYAPLRLEPGDSVYFDSGMAHGYVRVGEAPCQVLSLCAGSGIQRFAKADIAG